MEFFTAKIVWFFLCYELQTANQKIPILFHYPRVNPGDYPLTKKPEDSGYEIGRDTLSDMLQGQVTASLSLS